MASNDERSAVTIKPHVLNPGRIRLAIYFLYLWSCPCQGRTSTQHNLSTDLTFILHFSYTFFCFGLAMLARKHCSRPACQQRQPSSVTCTHSISTTYYQHRALTAAAASPAGPARLPCGSSQLQQHQQHITSRRSMLTAAAPPQDLNTGSKARLAVFVSGGGSNFKAIHAACQDGRINAEVVVSITGCSVLCTDASLGSQLPSESAGLIGTAAAKHCLLTLDCWAHLRKQALSWPGAASPCAAGIMLGQR
jgi:hypothetical protein